MTKTFYEVTILDNETLMPVGGISTTDKVVAVNFRNKAAKKGLAFTANF